MVAKRTSYTRRKKGCRSYRLNLIRDVAFLSQIILQVHKSLTDEFAVSQKFAPLGFSLLSLLINLALIKRQDVHVT